MLLYLFIFNLLSFILLKYLVKFNSLNHYLLSNYSVSSLFLRTASAQNSYFNLFVFKEFLFVKLHSTSFSVVNLFL